MAIKFRKLRTSPRLASGNTVGPDTKRRTLALTEPVFRIALYIALIFFTTVFAVVVLPPLIAEPDVIGAFAAGFVNPYASGYATDVLVCWGILAAWVAHEARRFGVRHGWICLVLGVVPGVAVGFALYLLIRRSQLHVSGREA